MDNPSRLAVAQTVPVAGDVDANVRQHLQLTQTAAGEGVTLLAFPELSLTGYELVLGPTLAFEADDARLQPLVAAARACDMTLVVGAPARSAGGLHIAAFIILPVRDLGAHGVQAVAAEGGGAPVRAHRPLLELWRSDRRTRRSGGSCVRSADGKAVIALPAEGCGLAIAWENGVGWAGKAVLIE